jgi:DNA-directed RNA polymerase specialized sigma subunit
MGENMKEDEDPLRELVTSDFVYPEELREQHEDDELGELKMLFKVDYEDLEVKAPAKSIDEVVKIGADFNILKEKLEELRDDLREVRNIAIRSRYKEDATQSELAEEFGVTQTRVSHIVNE